MTRDKSSEMDHILLERDKRKKKGEGGGKKRSKRGRHQYWQDPDGILALKTNTFSADNARVRILRRILRF